VPSLPHLFAASAGAGLLGAVSAAALLPAGGLAPSLVAAAVAALLGAPAAQVVWRGEPTRRARLAVDLLVGAAWFSVVAREIPWWLALGVLVVALAARPVAGLLAGGAALIVGVVGASRAAMVGATDAMVPSLDGAWAWGPQAIVAGLLVAGVYPWTLGEPRRPGDRGSPWVVIGLGCAAMASLGALSAAGYSAGLGWGPDPWTVAAKGLMLAAFGAGWLASPRAIPASWARLVAWVGASAGALALPHGVLDVIAETVVPGGLGLVAWSGAWHARDLVGRSVLTAVGLGFVVGGALAWATPTRVIDATLLGCVVVIGFWWFQWASTREAR
jgi:hypothetical protein